jgi:hypothetical protein
VKKPQTMSERLGELCLFCVMASCACGWNEEICGVLSADPIDGSWKFVYRVLNRSAEIAAL